MRNFKLVFAVLIPLILLVPYTAFAQSSKIALNTDRDVYSIGMKVTVAGQVLGSFDPSKPVSISVKGPDGNTYHSNSIMLDEQGNFVYEFVIQDNASLGKSTLEVTHENSQGRISRTITFEVMDKATVTVQTSKDAYKLGEHVILSGTVSPVLPDAQVLIQVFNPKNNAWSFKSVSTNKISDGQFSIDLGKLDGKLSLLGVYTVEVTYAGSATTATSFSVVSDSKSGSQSSNTSTQTGSQSTPSKVTVEEKESESTSTATVAEETVIQSEIKNNEAEEQEFTYIVLVKDSEGLTVSLSWASGKLSPNQSITMERSWLPEEPGVYTAEIFIWESFENPVPLSNVVQKFIIVE